MPERRTINGELCERVERVADLLEMLLVWVKCDWCPGTMHRGALLNRRENVTGQQSNGAWVTTAGWDLTPNPGPPHDKGAYLIAESGVAAGYIWRVVDEARDDDRDALENKIVENEAAIRAIWTSQIHPERIVKVRG